MPHEESLARRAIIAMSLTIGFYLFAVILGLGTIALPFIISYATGKLFIKLVVVCFITGGAILIAIIPRPDKFQPPGPRLSPEKYPKLFGAIKELADATEQEMPADVYLVPEFNAWVAQRGGSGEFGGRRVMGLGLPLLKAMNISQFKAILAHEFGHFYHGDTKLGPRIYQTRAAIGRTIAELESRQSMLQAPFKWYGNLFLEITQSISRNQEFVADRLAARVAGRSAMISALKALPGQSAAFNMYWQQEFLPLINQAYLPPLLKGFDLFLQSGETQKIMSAIEQAELKEGKTNKYDTHPSLRERISFIEDVETDEISTDDSPAINLMDNPIDAESLLLKSIIKDEYYPKLKSIEWNNVYETVYIEDWKSRAANNAEFLAEITPRIFPEIASKPMEFLPRLFVGQTIIQQNVQNKMAEMVTVIGSGLIFTLIEKGWKLEAEIGKDVKLYLNDTIIYPFGTLINLANENLSKENWDKVCHDTGIADLTLAKKPEAGI